MEEAICIKDLWKKKDIFYDINLEYKGRAFLVSTKEITKNKSAWATNVVSDLYRINRIDLKNEACHISYIKFAKNKDDMILGIVGGKSQFHHKYRSDVCFYDLSKVQKNASNFMRQNELAWYEDEILIFKNLDNNSDEEARINEKMLQLKYKLFP